MKELKNLTLLLAFCLSISMFLSCSEDKPLVEPEQKEEETSEEEIQIKVQTKSADVFDGKEKERFQTKDEIGIYVVKGNNNTLRLTENYADNVKYVLGEDGTWQSENPICFPTDGESLTFYAYYPFEYGGLNDEGTCKLFNAWGDQSDDAKYKRSGIMSAICSDVKTSEEINLIFEDRLYHIQFALLADNEFSTEELMNAQVRVIDCITGRGLDLQTGAIVDPNFQNDHLIPNGEWKISEDNLEMIIGKRAYIIPQELSHLRTYIEVIVGNRVFMKKFRPALNLNGGESGLFILSFSPKELDLTPWEHTNPLHVVLDEDIHEPTWRDFIAELSINSSNKQVEIMLNSGNQEQHSYHYNFTIYWGDGSAPERFNGYGLEDKIVHIYPKEGTYELCILGYCSYFSMAGNSSLKNIKQWGSLSTQTWSNSFADCKNLENIASEITIVDSFNKTFENCTSLKYIPEDLFQGYPYGIHSIGGTFSGCTSLEYIPEGLFRGCENVTSFSETFSGCLITEIPANLFKGCRNVRYFSETFYSCPIKEIPARLFSDCWNVDSFYRTFAICENLTTIPSGLFENCTEVKYFTETFHECWNIKTIPENLFANCSNVINFIGTFGQNEIESVPANLFANCPVVESFQRTFEGNKLNVISEYLFANNKEVITFAGCFTGCSNLQFIPEKLFDNNKKVESFHGTFAGCESLKGTTPKTDGIELWMRSSYPQYPSSIDVAYCFSDCRELDNYDDIPREAKSYY